MAAPKKTAAGMAAGMVVIVASVLWGGRSESEVFPAVRGITLDARRAPSTGLYQEVEDLGISHVAIVPYAFFRGDSLRFNPEARWFSESETGAVALADSLERRGIKLVIKPQLWMGRDQFPGDLSFPTEADWRAWEHDYHRYILHYASLAERVDSDWFVVGTELAQSARLRPEFWRSLIADVRDVFSGRLTYAANWYAEVDSLEFWDELDAIGVQGYYPLATSYSPDLGTLEEGWQAPTQGLRALSKHWRKPVLFTEIGYRSTSDAAIEPWLWTPRPGEAAADLDLQARLYTAFFDGPYREPFVAGAIVWKWYGGPGRGARELDFTPQDKPAAEVLSRAYLRPPQG